MVPGKIISTSKLGFPWQTRDPFLFCAYHHDLYPKGDLEMRPNASLEGRTLGQDFATDQTWRMYHGMQVPGFPQHPHRGFETVTIAKEGVVDHADSLGAAGRFGNGDVQWMTAGSGVLHSEMFPLLNTEKENPLDLFQIWLNLPKKSKMVPPHFSMIWSEDIPKITHLDGEGRKSRIDVIAGSIEGHKAPPPAPDSWAADTSNDVAIWTVQMDSQASWVIPSAREEVHRTIYFYQGDQLQIDGHSVLTGFLIEVNPKVELTIKNGDAAAKLLILQGKPINEPIAKYGPFVMNTQSEIQEAFAEFQKTQFGGWPWPKDDQVHDSRKGRFALYADGTLEEKS